MTLFRVESAAVALLVAPFVLIGACGVDEGTVVPTESDAGSSGSSGSSGADAQSDSSLPDGADAKSDSSLPVTSLDCAPPTGAIPVLELTEIGAGGFGQALLIQVAPGDDDTLYVVDRTGTVWISQNGVKLPTPFLTVTTQTPSEEGLLGLAFHPDYKTNGRFFVHYSAAGSGDNIVEEYKRSAANPLVADPTPVVVALQHPTAQANHNGGGLAFGPDGFLYVSMGDGGNQNDPECDAQLQTGGAVPGEPENLLGKITRLDANKPAVAGTGFVAAAGNPNGKKAYHVGFRNPFRIGFDACTGDLYIGDVGQNAWEEVDLIKPADGAVNCGWPYREGANDFAAPATCPVKPAGLKEPIANYDHQNGRNSIIGGYVYRSSTIQALRGAYFYGDNGTGEIWYKLPGAPPVLTAAKATANLLGGFGQDGHGKLYIGTLNGHIFRIDAQ
jgi:glucose/arabinose dehydrogenase